MDVVTYLIALLDPAGTSAGAAVTSIDGVTSFSGTNSWANSSNAVLGTSLNTPTIIDIRSAAANRGRRYDLSSGDLITVYETSNSVEYPTISWDVRNENFTLTIDMRTIQDERGVSDENFARDRLANLYKVVRHRLEQNRKGATIVLSGETEKIDQLHLGSRTESNDKRKRIFGYKLTVDLKKISVAIP
tara:strand:- start:7959 stop:8525 length:567 start_codon:yes stop_codon:yes gene_type:complete